MLENDAIHAFQRTTPRRTKAKNVTNAAKQTRDEFIMDTNNSSIVSKRSVEKLYYDGQPEYFRYFVNKFKRRSPLINRGYHLRMRAVDYAVEQFLQEPTQKQKVVINLGCGYDPLPWLFLGKRQDLCHQAKFIDVDYSPLMQKKVEVIKRTSQLTDILPGLNYTSAKDGVLCDSQYYAAVGCDLYNLDYLRYVLREQLQVEDSSIAILFVAEVSIAYMDLQGSQAVLEWAAAYEDVRFCLLEQHLPDGRDHPFAETMLKHFDKLRTPLHAIGTMSDMCKRFEQAGWPTGGINIRSLWRLWSDPTFLTSQQRRDLDKIEPFDEWEELALFASHYFLLVARKCDDSTSTLASAMPQQEFVRGPDITCKELEPPYDHRRFSVVIPAGTEHSTIAIHGGLGTKERLSSIGIYATSTHELAQSTGVEGPPIREGLMCHSVTELDGAQVKCLLVGGRASPDKSARGCWYRVGNRWTQVQSLPSGRYRHCAVAYTFAEDRNGVLIYGGKSDASTVCHDVLCWEESRGWFSLQVKGTVPPARFGAAMGSDFGESCQGILLGGMTEEGIICQDIYRWSIKPDDTITFEDVTGEYRARLGPGHTALYRFGAQLSKWHIDSSKPKTLLIGGVGHEDALTRNNEILSLTDYCTHPLSGPHPLLVGCSLQDRTILGGGATCFSFGTFWNTSYALELAEEATHPESWHLYEPATTAHQRAAEEQADSTAHQAAPDEQADIADSSTPTHHVPVIQLTTAESFQQILKAGRPVIIRNCILGSCTSKWTPEYLKNTIGDRKVVIHSSDGNKMDFKKKNFRYETQQFGDFINAVENGGMLYMRALSSLAPSETPTNLAADFPEIANDFVLPPELAYVDSNAHSTPLRISGRTIMWLHYDVMSNILCQIRGSKTLMLYPPADVVHLGVEAGMSSSSVDVFDRNLPGPQKCHPHEAELQPGDVLFIPSLWLHSAAPTDGMSVAVNVFFRHLQHGYAAGRDVYGNRDLAAYERGRKDVARLAKSFADLPADISHFYLERLILELRSLARMD